MKERDEIRNGKHVTVVDKEPGDLTIDEQLADLARRVATLEQQATKGGI